MKTVVYVTEIPQQYEKKNMEHMTGEKLLEEALMREYGKKLMFEPRARGEHGKPFFTLQPGLHYNISHSGKYVVCALADREVGIDLQEHREVDYGRLLQRMVPQELAEELLKEQDVPAAFYRQWVLWEAYVKWTGEGFSRDFRTIPLDRGGWALLDIAPGYSCAVWSGEKPEIRLERIQVSLP